MKKSRILFESYFSWHYGRAFVDLFRVWMNFIWFIFNFFSVSVLLGSFFSPWKRMGESYPKNFDIAETISTFIVNTLMRLVGMCMRSVVLGISFFCVSVIFFFGLVVCFFWIFLPIFFVAILFISLHLIFYVG
jgi:hypothetical protein